MNKYFKQFGLQLLGVVCLWLSLISLGNSQDPVAMARTEYLGFSPAFPITQTSTPDLLTWFQSDTLMRATAVLTIDSSGCVIRVEPESPADSQLVSECEDYVKALNFAAGMSNGHRIESKLAVKIMRQARTYLADISFPLDGHGLVIDGELYLRSLAQNGISPASIVSFPSVFCTIKSTDSIAIPPMVVLNLLIDSTGTVKEVRRVFSDSPAFEQQVESASLWGKYRPASVEGRPVASRLWVAVSFLPLVGYPTKPWSAQRVDSNNLQDRYVVQSGIEPRSPIRLPLLTTLFRLEFSSRHELPSYYPLIEVRLSVDSLGHAQAASVYPPDPALLKLIRKMVQDLKFYPAVLPDGRPVSYSGVLQIEPRGARRSVLTQTWLR